MGMNARIWMMQRKEVCLILGTSSAGLHRGMIDGRYPKPYRTGDHSVRWKSNEISDCIDKLKVSVPVEVAPGAKRGRPRKLTKVEV